MTFAEFMSEIYTLILSNSGGAIFIMACIAFSGLIAGVTVVLGGVAKIVLAFRGIHVPDTEEREWG